RRKQISRALVAGLACADEARWANSGCSYLESMRKVRRVMASHPKRPSLLSGARAFAALAHDVVMAALALLLSIYLRYGEDFAALPGGLIAGYVAGFAAIAAVVFLGTGLYRGIWRYASLPDVIALVRATTLTIFIAALAFFFVTRLEAMPRST